MAHDCLSALGSNISSWKGGSYVFYCFSASFADSNQVWRHPGVKTALKWSISAIFTPKAAPVAPGDCFNCIKVDDWIPQVGDINKRVSILKFWSPMHELGTVPFFTWLSVVIYTPGSISFVTELFKGSKQDTLWNGDLWNLRICWLQVEEMNMIGASWMHEMALVQKSL